MPRRIPSLRRHRPSSRAVVTLNGQDHYLGPWPAGRKTPAPDVQAGYERLIAEWLEWPGKAGVTFSDSLTAVRRWLWADGVFPQAVGPAAVRKLPPDFRELLLHGLANAA